MALPVRPVIPSGDPPANLKPNGKHYFPTKIEKCLVTFDDGKTLIIPKNQIETYQKNHPEAIFKKVEPYQPAKHKAGK